MDLQVFNQNGWEIRTIEKDGAPWFVASDVAKILEYKDPSDAIRRHCKKVNKINQQGVSGVKNAPPVKILIIPESDIYRLIMRSKLEKAEEFQDWVVEEVLPAIRKTGSYSKETPQSFSEALQLAADQAKQIEEQKPMVDFAKSIEGTNQVIGFGDFAKVNGTIGRNNLFKLLRSKKVLMPSNIPYQKYVDSGYFEVREKVIETNSTFTDIISKTSYITGKGQLWLDKKIKEWV